MLNIPTDYIINKIKETKGLSEEEIRDMISSKLESLSGLISEQGAAHIIANELGVKLLDTSERLQVKNLLSGMRNVELVGKIIQTYEKRTFANKAGGQGQLGSFLMGDESGRVRVVLWGEKADMLTQMSPGTIVKISGAYTKENPGFGGSPPRIEIHMGDSAKLILNPEGEEVKDVGNLSANAVRKNISELANGEDNIELLGTVVQAFDTNYFEVCPQCQKRVKASSEGFVCITHGNIQPVFSYVTNVVIDDGTDSIRAVFFRNQAQHLFNKTDEEMQTFRGGSFDELKNDLLGKIIKLNGRVTSNQMFNRLEFVVKTVDSTPNPEDELKRLEKQPNTVKKEVKKSELIMHSKPAASKPVKFEEKKLVKEEDEEETLLLEDEDESEDIYE